MDGRSVQTGRSGRIPLSAGRTSRCFGRLEGDVWTTWGEQVVGEFDANLPVGHVAAPDGALWIAEKIRTFGLFEPPVMCQGVARFDGTHLEHFLENLCVRSPVRDAVILRAPSPGSRAGRPADLCRRRYGPRSHRPARPHVPRRNE